MVFLEDYDLDEARATVLQSRGKPLEAAQAHAKEGRVLEAVRVLLESPTPSIEESRMATHYVLTGFWKCVSFGAEFHRSDAAITNLLQISSRLDSNAVTEDEVDEVRFVQPLTVTTSFNPRAHQLSMFKLIAQYNREPPVDLDVTGNVDPAISQFRLLAFKFLGRKNDVAALVCLDHVFSRPPTLRKVTLIEIESLLSLYLTYVRLLDQLWRDDRLSRGSNRQKVFAFDVQEGRYLIPKGTFVHREVSAARGILDDPPPEYVLSREDLSRITSNVILNHIKTRVEIQERACRETRGFSPCLYTLIGRNCTNERCPFQHVQPNEITTEWFHRRLRFLFLEFQILRLAQLFDKGVMQYVHNDTSFRPC